MRKNEERNSRIYQKLKDKLWVLPTIGGKKRKKKKEKPYVWYRFRLE